MTQTRGSLRNELEVFKALFEERWNAHDKRSDEIWKEIKTHLGSISEHMSELPCKTMIERVSGHTQNFKWVWGLIIPVILTILGMALRMFIML